MKRIMYVFAASILLVAFGCQNEKIENIREDNPEETIVVSTDTPSVTVPDTDSLKEDDDTEEKVSEDILQEEEDNIFEPEENPYQAYINFIQNSADYEWDGRYYEMYVKHGDDPGWDSFQLIDFDGDGSEELIVTNRSEDRSDAGMQYYLIVDWYDGEIVISELSDGVASAGGYRGTKYYLPGKGIIYDMSISAPFGSPGFSVYEFSDGKFEYSIGGYLEPDSDYDNPGQYDNGTLYWDGKEVSIEEFKKYEADYSDDYSGIALLDIDYLDKESMLKILAE